MKNFNQRGGGGGGFRPENRGFGRSNNFNSNRGDRGPVTLHKATCSDCGNVCEVPFRPTGEKPVYCNNCFASKREGGERSPRKEYSARPEMSRGFDKHSNSDARSSNSGNEDIKRQLEMLGSKIDQLARVISQLSLKKDDKNEDQSATDSKVESKPKLVLKKVEVKKVVKKVPVAKKKVLVKKAK